jgi:hypothetical protein
LSQASNRLSHQASLRASILERLAGQLALDVSLAFHFAGARAEAHDIDFNADLIARGDGAAKLGAVDSGEDGELGVPVLHFGEHQDRAGLSHGLNDEHTGH